MVQQYEYPELDSDIPDYFKRHLKARYQRQEMLDYFRDEMVREMVREMEREIMDQIFFPNKVFREPFRFLDGLRSSDAAAG